MNIPISGAPLRRALKVSAILAAVGAGVLALAALLPGDAIVLVAFFLASCSGYLLFAAWNALPFLTELAIILTALVQVAGGIELYLLACWCATRWASPGLLRWLQAGIRDQRANVSGIWFSMAMATPLYWLIARFQQWYYGRLLRRHALPASGLVRTGVYKGASPEALGMGTHVYRYAPSLWPLYLGIGMLCMAIAVGLLVANWSDAVHGSMSLLGYLLLAIEVLFMLVFGLALSLLPFVTRIVVSPQGLDYHTLAAVVHSDWRDLENAGPRVDDNGNFAATVLVSRLPKVTLRGWARYAPWDVVDAVLKPGIPVSQFGGFRGKLRADLHVFAPHLGTE